MQPKEQPQRRNLAVMASLEAGKTQVALPEGQKPESLTDLVASGEVGTGVVERAEKDLSAARETIERMLTECQGLVVSATMLPRYLQLIRKTKDVPGTASKEPELTSGKWEKIGKPGMIIYTQKGFLGLVISIVNKNNKPEKYICRSGNRTEEIEPGLEERGYHTIPDTNQTNHQIKFANIEQLEDKEK